MKIICNHAGECPHSQSCIHATPHKRDGSCGCDCPLTEIRNSRCVPVAEEEEEEEPATPPVVYEIHSNTMETIRCGGSRYKVLIMMGTVTYTEHFNSLIECEAFIRLHREGVYKI